MYCEQHPLPPTVICVVLSAVPAYDLARFTEHFTVWLPRLLGVVQLNWHFRMQTNVDAVGGTIQSN